MIAVLLYPFKIVINTNIYLNSFAFAKFVNKPLLPISIVLAVIAAVHAMTGWKYIGGSIFPSVGKGYPVVLSENMPQPTLPTAISATIVEVIKAAIPVLISESKRKAHFTGTSALFVYPSLLLAFFSIPFILQPYFVRIVLPIFFNSLAYLLLIFFLVDFMFIAVRFIIKTIRLSQSIDILCSIFFVIFTQHFSVISPVLLLVHFNLFGITLSVILAVLLYFSFPLPFSVCTPAMLAIYVKPIFSIYIIGEIFICCWKIFEAFTTTLRWRIRGIINISHGVYLALTQSPTSSMVRGLCVPLLYHDLPRVGAQ